MTERTPHLDLPYILPSQAQKHVTHNEALDRLDAIVHLAVLDRDLAAPPSLPAEGSRYLVAAGGSGAWASHDGKIATRIGEDWEFLQPRTGWTVWIADEAALLAFTGASWTPVSTFLGGAISATTIGINATADATNRLSLKAAATLFDNAGGDHRVIVNKANAAGTASVLYQDGYSGRAEIGLCGDDDFHFKVSADGSSFSDALILRTGATLSVAQAGSAATPALSGPTAGSGLFFSGSSLGFSTGGVGRVTIGSTQFTVSTPVAIQNQVTVGANGRLAIYDNASHAILQTGGGASLMIYDAVGGRTPFYIEGASARIGIMTTSPAAGYALDVNGNIRCTALTQTSGAALKSDAGAPLGLDFVLSLTPRAYRWKDGGTRPHQGFFAEEVRDAAKSAGADFGGFKDRSVCEPGRTGQFGLDYSEFIAPLVAAIQALHDRIVALESRSGAGA